MAGTRREDERREETIRAVWASLARSGVPGTTIESVAALAGFSKGVIHYWFASKRDLLLAAFEAFMAEYDREILERLTSLGRQPGPGDILEAVIDATLPRYSPDQAEAQALPLPKAGEGLSPAYKARLFITFFGLALGDPGFGEVVARNYQRQVSAMAEAFRALAPDRSEAEVLGDAASLTAMIDGFALHRVLGYLPEGIAAHGNLAKAFVNLRSKP